MTTINKHLTFDIFDNHCLAVLCKFLGLLGKRNFFSKDRLN